MKIKNRVLLTVFGALFGLHASAEVQLEKIKLPKDFKISVYAKRLPGARSLALSENGTLFVGSREGSVYAVDSAGKVYTIAKDLNEPNGVALFEGSLYVAEINRVLRFDNIERNLNRPLAFRVVTDSYPTDNHHGWKFIAFGPDKKLYVPVGAPCNVCEPKEPYATITRINPDGSGREIVARGVRNTVGFDWHPVTKELWFTDNGRDMLGDDSPPDELNRVTKVGQHFGFPYCHGGDLAAPEFGSNRKCSEFESPEQKLDAHVAALGMRFYTGKSFPSEYHNQIFIAEHGSWNRTKPVGYRVTTVKVGNNGHPGVYSVFAEGWLNNGRAWGRPVDLVVAADGSLLVSDDLAGVIYKITFQP